MPFWWLQITRHLWKHQPSVLQSTRLPLASFLLACLVFSPFPVVFAYGINAAVFCLHRAAAAEWSVPSEKSRKPLGSLLMRVGWNCELVSPCPSLAPATKFREKRFGSCLKQRDVWKEMIRNLHNRKHCSDIQWFIGVDNATQKIHLWIQSEDPKCCKPRIKSKNRNNVFYI